jgi:hypothetical protein
MSEPSQVEIEPPVENPFPFEVREMTYLTAEVKSNNYESLMDAMGAEKFKAYKWGEGLNSIKPELREALTKISPDGATFSFSEYVEKGKVKNNLFIEKTMEDGVRCVYVVNTDESQPHVYKLDNLYVVGRNAKTVDLLEELDQDQTAYFVPVAITSYEADSKTLFFGDLDLLSSRTEHRLGIPAYVHEVGHAKDSKLNPKLFEAITKLKGQKFLALAINSLEQKFPGIWKSDNKLIKKAVESIGEAGKYILLSENNATDYVRVFMTRKRAEGIDLSPSTPGGSFVDELETSLANYELTYYGEQRTETVQPGYIGHVYKDLNVIREAEMAALKFLWKLKGNTESTKNPEA